MRFYHVFKRFGDIVIALVGLIILIPLFILISIWVKSSSKGPAVYNHTRIGKNKVPFTIYKFRSMVVGARELQKKGVPDKKLITFAGRFLRRSFFDETLQLLNLLKGDISLVGPRPKDKERFEELVKKNKRWNDIVKIRPGITSLESVADYLSTKGRIKFEKHFKGLLSKDNYLKGKDTDFSKHIYILDLYYVNNESLFFDLKIVFFTFLLMIKRIFSSNT